MPSSAPLCKVYIDALCGRAIYVHAGLKGSVAHFGFEPFRKTGLVAKFWFARPAHAELVALWVFQDFRAVGAMQPHKWVDLPPYEVVDKIKSTAALLGARWQTEVQIRRDAETAVAEITRQVEAARQNGGLQQVNAAYKQYRQAQIEKGEPAIPYSAHIAHFTRSLVLRAAQKSLTQIALRVHGPSRESPKLP
jgi:hypothetical protein